MPTPPDCEVLDYRRTGPTALRLVVGARLRQLREAAGISSAAAGYQIRASAAKISRMELGRTGFKPRDLADLLTLYGVTDETERATLLAMAEHASTPGWWQAYGDVIPPWLETYIGLEQAADVIRTWEPQVVPGLLQTPDYARAVVRLDPHVSPAEVERRVALRAARRRIFDRPAPARLWAVIDEAALLRPIGGAAVLRDQLDHLIRGCELPYITIQVMPLDRGGHPALSGPVSILRFPQDALSDVVYLEQLAGAVYLDKPDDVTYYWDVMNRLVVTAEPVKATVSILRRIRAEL